MRCRLPLPLPCLLALACAPASVIVPSSAPAPETSLAPPPSPSPVSPEPAPDPGPSRVESSLVEEPLRLEVELVRGERRHRILTVPVDLDEEMMDHADADQFVVEGSDGRVVFVQLFLETGEDIFRRDIRAFAIDTERGEVIWDGDGGYANSFGYCETVDVPEPRAEGEVLIIDRWTGTFRHDDMEPLGDPCMPVPEQRVEEARLGL